MFLLNEAGKRSWLLYGAESWGGSGADQCLGLQPLAVLLRLPSRSIHANSMPATLLWGKRIPALLACFAAFSLVKYPFTRLILATARIVFLRLDILALTGARRR